MRQGNRLSNGKRQSIRWIRTTRNIWNRDITYAAMWACKSHGHGQRVFEMITGLFYRSPPTEFTNSTLLTRGIIFVRLFHIRPAHQSNDCGIDRCMAEIVWQCRLCPYQWVSRFHWLAVSAIYRRCSQGIYNHIVKYEWHLRRVVMSCRFIRIGAGRKSQ